TPQKGPVRYASLLTREHEKINWARGAQAIHNQIRGLNPWPGSYTTFRGETVKVWKSTVSADEKGYDFKPGEIIECNSQGLLVQTGEGLIRITEVQPAGKKSMPARDFFLGRHGQVGEGLS
ncbi:MAG TPA: methionyl-tRNA formyltransferase, partial [Desulfitobacterium dehalogenans]|nr:methionyl-tRNA formyltransferase [Desulfitobacterium dehalogenans]